MENVRYNKAGFRALSADSESGIVKAIVSVYDVVNSQNSVIRYGAFSESIARQLPAVVVEHNWSSPNAVTLTAKELPPNDPLLPDEIKEYGGLYVEGQYFPDIKDSWDTFLKIKNGVYREYSIAFEVTESNILENEVEEITKGTLFEWCPVFIGANAYTSTISTMSALPINEDTEAVLAQVQRNIARWEHRLDMRLNAGRKISAENMAELNTALDVLQEGVNRIKSVVKKASPLEAQSDETIAARIRLAAVRAQRSLNKQGQ